MKKIVMAAIAAGLICSTMPAFAVDATTAAAPVIDSNPATPSRNGIGIDMTAVGKTADEHRAFNAKLAAEDRAKVMTACKLPDRTPEEKAYCADIM